MAYEMLDRFRQIVLLTPALQAQLWNAPDVDVFVRLVQQLSAEQGYPCSREAIKAALSTSRREWRDHGPVDRTVADLDGWIPIRVGERGREMVVEWCYLGTQRFTAPFFDQTVAACLRHPLNRLVRLQTPIDTLGHLHETKPGVAPCGFIFHMSRCGSTLIARLLASLPQVMVISEAEPIDAVLRAHVRDSTISNQQRCRWLQWVVSALGRRRTPHEQHLCIKFDSWSILELPLIRRAFPDVPWVFVYREPIEVMVSHQQMRGSQMVPGMIEPALLGLNEADIQHMSLDEYCARTLTRICGAAVVGGIRDDGQFVNYRQLPKVVWSALLDVFGIAYTARDIERMHHVAQFHAKSPSTHFHKDTTAKQQKATDELRRLAEQWVRPPYQQLIELQHLSDADWPPRGKS